MISRATFLEYLRSIYLVIFFIWVSFFPQPIQARYWVPTQIFLIIFLLILLYRERYLSLIFSLQDWPLWLFLIALAVNNLSAKDKAAALNTYAYLALNFSLLFYIGKSLFYYEDSWKRMAIIICLCGCLVAFIGLLELYFGKNILYQDFITNPYYERYITFYPRPMSTQLNPVVLGSYLLFCLPFGFYFLKAKPTGLRFLGILSAFLCATVIILTYSRGVFLGLLGSVLFYVWNIGRRKLFFLLGLSLIFIIITSSFINNSNVCRFGFKNMIYGSYNSIFSEYRFKRAKMTLHILKEHPFSGVGLNNFRIRFDEYAVDKDERDDWEFMIPDNMYLTFLAETGIIGALGFCVFIVLLFRRALASLMKPNEAKDRLIFVAFLSALVGLLINMSAYELFYWNNPYMLFCLACGFIQGFSGDRFADRIR